jgi:CHASE3 domain sensor protein
MRARRMRRRLFNVFAFACLAFAIYLIAFAKEERNLSTGTQTARTTTGEKSAIKNN